MAIEIKKPTTFAEGALLLWTDEANCYDVQGTGGDETTFGYQTLDSDESPSIRFHTWETKGQTYTATVLKLKWKTSIQTGDDEFGIEYTKNGGGAWADLVTKGANRSVAYTTAEIALDTNQDLAQVEVRVNSDRVKGGDGCDLQISDIWTEGTYTEGGITVEVNQLVAKVVILAATILTGATVPVNQLTAKIVPLSVEVKTGATTTVNLQTLKVIPLSPTVKCGATIETNLLTAKVVPYSPTIITDCVVEVSLLTAKIVPYSPTVKYGVVTTQNLLINKVVPYEVTVDVGGGVTVEVNLLNIKLVPYSVTVKSGATVSTNLLTNKIIPISPAVSCGAKVQVSQSIVKVVPYPVTVVADGGNPPVPVKLITGVMSESLHIRGIMSKEFSAIRCLDFNGSTDYVNCGNDASLNMGTGDFTIEAWIKGTEDNWRHIAGKREDANSWYRLTFSNGKLTLELAENYPTNPASYTSSSADVNDDILHHVIALRNNSNLELYIDLSRDGTGNSSYNVDNTKKFLIGAFTIAGSNPFNGLICIVRIYKNKALNATERKNNFNGKITQDGLVAEWLMREQQGNILHDTSINSNDGTIYGADWYEEKFNTPLKGIMSNSSEITGIMTAEYI